MDEDFLASISRDQDSSEFRQDRRTLKRQSGFVRSPRSDWQLATSKIQAQEGISRSFAPRKSRTSVYTRKSVAADFKRSRKQADIDRQGFFESFQAGLDVTMSSELAGWQGEDVLFDHVVLHPDGGLHTFDVEDTSQIEAAMFTTTKLIKFILRILLAVFNGYILFTRLNLQYNSLPLQWTADFFLNRDLTKQEYISRPIQLLVNPRFHHLRSFYLWTKLAVDIFETAFFSYMAIDLIYMVLRRSKYMYYPPEWLHFHPWYRLYVVTAHHLRRLPNYSAMTFLSMWNVPQVKADFAITVAKAGHGTAHKDYWLIVQFFFKSFLLGAIGFFTFLARISDMTEELKTEGDNWNGRGNDCPIQGSTPRHPDSGQKRTACCRDSCIIFYQLVTLFSFLNQARGVALSWSISEKRLFLLIFGGEDCRMKQEQLEIQQAYLAAITQRVYTKLWTDKTDSSGKTIKAPWKSLKRSVALCCLSDVELQKVMLQREDSVQGLAAAEAIEMRLLDLIPWAS